MKMPCCDVCLATKGAMTFANMSWKFQRIVKLDLCHAHSTQVEKKEIRYTPDEALAIALKAEQSYNEKVEDARRARRDALGKVSPQKPGLVQTPPPTKGARQ